MPRAEADTKYCHYAVQRSEPDWEGTKKEGKLLIIFKLFKLRVSRRHSHAPLMFDADRLSVKAMWVSFSDFKHQVSASNPNTNTEDYKKQISSCLRSLSVPEEEHRVVIQKLFRAVEAAETTQLPVVVGVWKANRRIMPYTRPVDGSKVTPASTSAIEGLKSLVQVDESVLRQTPSCAICLEDFLDHQKLPITELPCRHRFHVHCIVQCLEINHLCPLCRYAMPT